ncbi:PadR family transcriptional regulator [Roseobacter sp. YSTF-M11]|uniref:PadR family transcriptional regulator n=1 Tax=Roseobacter insulae TaxID=2859783 RepID=A0A9X1FXM1_9RHOB|nr:PadR family transcriptional regulator [Roseobacter insulae]MBW4709581.1 PadR family transcriptional regulator [Roseobacter insulae]
MIPRLSKIEYQVLDLLRSGVEMYGLELVKASNGALKRGTIYVTLNRMVEKGYLTSRAEDEPSEPGLPRRRYRVSGHGARVLSATDTASAAFEGGSYA